MGITVAEKGIYKVTGKPNQGIQSFQVSKNNDQVEVTVLGKTYKKPIPGKEKESATKKEQSSKPTSPKQPVQEEKGQSSTYIGEIGNAISSTLQLGAEKGFEILASFID